MTAQLTVPQLLLKAALTLSEPFHESQLAVAAWQLDPQRMGMRTMETIHPDVNRVRQAIVGNRGLVKKERFEHVGDLTYRLTPKGRADAELAVEGKRGAVRAVRVPAEIEEELVRMSHSRAWRRFLSGIPIEFADALRFWGTDRLEKPTHLLAALAFSQQCLADAGDYLTGEGLYLTGGRVIPPKELDRLRACDASLREAFRWDLSRRGT